jgi:starvation-inducible DNA-binding protein
MAQTATVFQPKAHSETLDLGLSKTYCSESAQALTDILASTYKLMVKSHIYHWNVVGPLFKPLHELTEEHYGVLFTATDTIAERIRALGQLAPARFSETSDFAPSAREVNTRSAEEMLEDLITDHTALVKSLRQTARKADEAGDLVTADMLTTRLEFHEQALWMLRAITAS